MTTLNKMLWSATGASKPMDQKSYIYIYIYSFVILNSGTFSGSIELLFLYIFFYI
jgi:hypothetical protein